MPTRTDARDDEWRWWTGLQMVLSAALVGTLLWAMRLFADRDVGRFLEPWQRHAMNVLILAGAVAFGVRTVVLLVRLFGGRPRR